MSNLNDLWDYDSVVRRPKKAVDEDASDAVWPTRSKAKAAADAEVFEHPAAEVVQQPPAAPLSSPDPRPQTSHTRGQTILRRGHAITFVGLFLFTAVLYFRPYELIPALAAFDRLALWFAIATLAIFIPSQFIVEGTLTTWVREVQLVLLLTLVA